MFSTTTEKNACIGDCLIEHNLCKVNKEEPLNFMAKNILLEIMDNAIEMANNKIDRPIVENFQSLKLLDEAAASCNEMYENTVSSKNEDSNGTYPLVEKKSRLTNLVKNSRKILAKIMNDKKSNSQEDKIIDNEEILKIIEPSASFQELQQIGNDKDNDQLYSIDLSTLSDTTCTVDLDCSVPDTSTSFTACKSLLTSENHSPNTSHCTSAGSGLRIKKTFTLPRVNSSKIKKSLSSKYGTLKKSTINMKSINWNVTDKMANFFHVTRGNKDEKKTAANEVSKMMKNQENGEKNEKTF